MSRHTRRFHDVYSISPHEHVFRHLTIYTRQETGQNRAPRQKPKKFRFLRMWNLSTYRQVETRNFTTKVLAGGDSALIGLKGRSFWRNIFRNISLLLARTHGYVHEFKMNSYHL
jgi:hypothetical protein